MEEDLTTATERQVCPFFLENRCRFGDQCRNSHPPQLEPQPPPTIKVIPPTVRHDADDTLGEGKARMRTANEVINRIQWDSSLNAPDFLVVYLDRFTGLASIPLTEYVAMSPEAAIPQHRIERICYKSELNIVWDKRRRLDYVFNSTASSSETTLQQFIQSIDDS